MAKQAANELDDLVFSATAAEIANIIAIPTDQISRLLLDQATAAAQAEWDSLGWVAKQSMFEQDEGLGAWATVRAQQVANTLRSTQARAISAVQNHGLRLKMQSEEIAQFVRMTGTGLHSRWAIAVMNRARRDLDRLRRLHPDWSLQRIQTEVNSRAQGYADRLLRSRMLTVAQTELVAADNQGKIAAWIQSVASGFLDIAGVRKVWKVGPYSFDGKSPCPVCKPLEGQTADVIGGMFNTPSGPVSSPPIHPNCRCTVRLQFNNPLQRN